MQFRARPSFWIPGGLNTDPIDGDALNTERGEAQECGVVSWAAVPLLLRETKTRASKLQPPSAYILPVSALSAGRLRPAPSFGVQAVHVHVGVVRNLVFRGVTKAARLGALPRFLASQEAADFVGFILALNAAVKGRKLSDACHVSSSVMALVEVMTTLSQWVDDIPPAAHTLRYGNPAFRHVISFSLRMPLNRGSSAVLHTPQRGCRLANAACCLLLRTG